jgi:hypothetical protein
VNVTLPVIAQGWFCGSFPEELAKADLKAWLAGRKVRERQAETIYRG